MTPQEIAEPNTILRGLVGSTVHGLAVDDGLEDRDEMGVCLEPPECVVGFQKFEQWTYRTQPEGVRSKAGDLDLCVYSLRKWARLAMNGNPSVLLLLFVPPEQCTVRLGLGTQLQELAPAFAAKSAGRAYLGYMEQQRRRLANDTGQKPNRPELVEKYGFDTKYAGHILRLGYQGIEFLKSGKVTLPMPHPERNFIRMVRCGTFTLKEVLDSSCTLENEIRRLHISGDLPAEPDKARIETFVVDCYREWWKAKAWFVPRSVPAGLAMEAKE